jgi:hypothetical protein
VKYLIIVLILIILRYFYILLITFLILKLFYLIYYAIVLSFLIIHIVHKYTNTLTLGFKYFSIDDLLVLFIFIPYISYLKVHIQIINLSICIFIVLSLVHIINNLKYLNNNTKLRKILIDVIILLGIPILGILYIIYNFKYLSNNRLHNMLFDFVFLFSIPSLVYFISSPYLLGVINALFTLYLIQK